MGRCPGVQLMSIVRWLLQKPGTMELAPFQKLLPQVGGHEQRLRGLTDGELTFKDKEKAVVGQVAAAHATGRPILIGTLDVAESERLAGELGRAGMRCTVLNAKNDAEEAAIVAEAGACGAITVSTQMAGRGTDIRLGGTGGDRNLIAGLGGLYVIGTGRHASSGLDHQLRGRAGRQGDPGGSVFFASMEDELIL